MRKNVLVGVLTIMTNFLFIGNIFGQEHSAPRPYNLSNQLNQIQYIGGTDSVKLAKGLKNPGLARDLSTYPTVGSVFLGSGILLLTNLDNGGIHSDRNNNFAIGLAGVGVLAGPSIGQFYASNEWQAVKGIGFRGLGMASSIGGYYNATRCALEDHFYGKECLSAIFIGSIAAFLGGSYLTIYYAVHDMTTADESAKEYNRQFRSKTKVSIFPFIKPESGIKGLTMKVSF